MGSSSIHRRDLRDDDLGPLPWFQFALEIVGAHAALIIDIDPDLLPLAKAQVAQSRVDRGVGFPAEKYLDLGRAV